MKIGNLKEYKSNIDIAKIQEIEKNLTPEEKKELVVSNIWGLMDYDSKVTKDEIRKSLDNFCGIYD